MKLSSCATSAFAALLLAALGQSAGFAATVSEAKRSMPIKTQPETQPHVTLPARTDVLAIDWVDTKNAKVAIGGITYAVVVGALPKIVLAGGEEVTNIGYLKSGMRVRIRTVPDATGHARLAEITVVA